MVARKNKSGPHKTTRQSQLRMAPSAAIVFSPGATYPDPTSRPDHSVASFPALEIEPPRLSPVSLRNLSSVP